MQASSETFVAIRLYGSRRFLRPPPLVWKQANVEMTNKDPALVAAPGQESDSHLRWHASKAEVPSQPSPDHWRGRRGNDEAPFLGRPEPRKSWQPPRPRAVW